jgi:hypothetical protein
MSGWTAHTLEQYKNNRLIRPRAEYKGNPDGMQWIPIGAPLTGTNMDERAYYTESETTRADVVELPSLPGPPRSYDLRWMVRKKKDRLPPGGDERDRARLAEVAELYGAAGRQGGLQEFAVPEAVRYIGRKDDGVSVSAKQELAADKPR